MARKNTVKTVAAIDTGTNSTRLMIAEAGGGKVRELARLTTVTRLGEGVDETGHLDRGAMARVSSCVDGYAEEIDRLNVEKTVVLATSSVRDAADGEEFLAAVARKHSFSYRLLSGDEEAALSFQGATFGIDEAGRSALLDIGGGSTEIAVGVDSIPDYARSLRMGCVRLTERFFHEDPASAAEMGAAAGFIDCVLKDNVDLSRIGRIDKTIAVAGTMTSLAAIDLGLKRYDRDAVHGHALTVDKVDSLLDRLAELTLRQKLAIATVEKGRADVIVAGALIASRTMRYLDIPEMIVSERDILDGAALKIADEWT